MLWTYLAVVNAATFAAFALDKRAARNNRQRTRESTLLTLALIGGSPGAIAAQRLMRHKTQKQPFAALLLAIVALQIAAVALYLAR